MPVIQVSRQIHQVIAAYAEREGCTEEALIGRALIALDDLRNTVALAAGLDTIVERLEGAPIGLPPDGLLTEDPVTLLQPTLAWICGAIALYRGEHRASEEMLRRQMRLHPEDFPREAEPEDEDEFLRGPSVWKRLRHPEL